MRLIFFFALLLAGNMLWAQQTASSYVKFGKITVDELQKKIYSLDSNANAVVLSDIGEAAIQGNSKSFFSLSFKRHRVVHILNKNGYDEANVEIPLYTDGDYEEKLDNLKAVTYNLENGKIAESKLEKSSIFKEKVSKNKVIRKFTMPNVKEGCIIEYEYTVMSDYIQNLDPWFFQGGTPVLWSEYTLTVPEFFSYGFLSHGYLPLYINDRKNRVENFSVMETRGTGASERISFTAGVTEYRWVMKDVPELKQESFTTSLKNHIASLEFQLASQSNPLPPHNYKTTWPALTNGLLTSESFGKDLRNNNNWLSDEVRPLLAAASTETGKARNIFNYVRDHFTCTDHSALWTQQSLKNVMRTKKGSVSEINLLLTAMLLYAGLNANPVILSTSDHGYVLEMYPMITSFNYVVSRLNADGKDYYLDASQSRLGFGKMLPECYNGHARIVDDMGTPVYLLADSLRERSVTAVFITNDEKGAWVGNVTKTSGYFHSYSIRDKVKEKGMDEYFKDERKEYGIDVKFRNTAIDSLDKLEEPVSVHYEIELDPGKEDILYFNPLFDEAWKKNPFASAVRYYPVEMPYTLDETYLLTMEVPNGFVVDELPKQIVAKMDEQESGFFEYRISLSGNTISMRTRVKIARTLFLPEEYEMLRAFFNLVVSKQSENIVFKRKK